MARLRRHVSSWNYPLWVTLGLVASGLVLWSQRSPSMSEAAGPALPSTPPSSQPSASPSASPPASPDAAPPVLTWHVHGAPALPSAATVTACLSRHAPPQAVATSTGTSLEVAWPSLPRPATVSFLDDGQTLLARLPRDADAHRTLSAFFALGACLYTPEASALVDVDLQRRYTPKDWPVPDPVTGVPVESAFAFDVMSSHLVSRGLERLGFREIAVLIEGQTPLESARVELQRGLVDLLMKGRPPEGSVEVNLPGRGSVTRLPPVAGRPHARPHARPPAQPTERPSSPTPASRFMPDYR